MNTPEKGKVVVVERIPNCDFCKIDDQESSTPGPYDFATTIGPWAHGCEAHWKQYRISPNLGTGIAQRWITKDQVTTS